MSKYVYPLKVSANKRYLVDQNDVPFLLQGDAPWSLIVGLTRQEAEQYLSNRCQKGFNTVMVNLIEHKYCRNPPKNAYGEEPFTKPGDFSTPNEKYFTHADWVIGKAAENGIQILLDPVFLGYKGGDEGWYKEMLSCGREKCFRYGQYLGNRYKDFDNIVWHIGADLNPGFALEFVDMIALGIKEYDKRHLFSAQSAPEYSAKEVFSSGGWLDINTTYSYGIVHRKLLEDYNQMPVMPLILVESTYEGEHNASQVQIRRQAYWAILCGALGHIFGNRPIWLFDKGWQDALDVCGSIDMMHWGNLFRSRDWYNLVPDKEHQVVIDGLGELRGLDYLSAARTANGSTFIAYMPASRKITIDMSRISGSKAKAWWFDPRIGKTTNAGEFPTKGTREFIPPGEGDWVIVLDAC
jgi:hypothetical protein